MNFVIPENKSGFRFWERTIKAYTNNYYTCEVKEVPFDKDQRRIFVGKCGSGQSGCSEWGPPNAIKLRK